jgi:hypothetical protein
MIEIFSLFRPDIDEWRVSDSRTGSVWDEGREIRRVANAELLRISQVCLRWHRLIIGTPSLWSIIDLDFYYWSNVECGRMGDVLKAVLERGANVPLDLAAQCPSTDAHHGITLALLAQHSRRWRDVSLSAYPDQLKSISAVKKNLPLLETLKIDIRGPDSIAITEVISFFEVAPRLTELWFRGSPEGLSKLPLQQLRSLVYLDLQLQDMDEFLPVMSRLPPGSDCHIRLFLEDDSDDDTHHPDTIDSLVQSNTTSLLLCVAGLYNENIAGQVLPKLTTHLTLPHLAHLRFVYYSYQGVPLRWPHPEFSALSDRSSFRHHLTCLELQYMFITPTELFETLSDLHSLEELGIADHQAVDGNAAERVLITSSLLERLTWTPDLTCLVPGLSFLELHTMHQFDDTVFRDFVLSRVTPGRNEAGPFELEFKWYSSHHRDLEPAVRTQIEELQRANDLLFSRAESDLFSTSLGASLS